MNGNGLTSSVQIFFDSNPQFSPGNEAKGKVLLVMHRAKQIQGMDLFILGKVKVSEIDAERQTARNVHRRNSSHRRSDKYFIMKETKSLDRENHLEDGRTVLPPGTYEYPFSFTLPDNIPCSFEGPFGFVRYKVQAIVRHSFWDHRCEAEEGFIVSGVHDLNSLNSVFKGVHVEQKWLNLSNCYGNAYLELTFELEKRAFVPGEEVRFAATTDFRSTLFQPPIQGVKVTLIQEQAYRIKSQVKKYFAKVHEISGPLAFPGSIEVWNSNFTLLPVPPTGLGGECRLIDVQYYLRVNLTYSEGQKIDILIKIQIGTEPEIMARGTPPPLAQLDDFRVSVERSSPVQDIEAAPRFFGPDYEQPPPAELVPGMHFLSVAGTVPRRASAPFLLEIEDNEPTPGPSSRMNFRPSSGRETPPPSYLDAISAPPSPNPDDYPPEYSAPPPYFLGSRRAQLLLRDDYNVYSTL